MKIIIFAAAFATLPTWSFAGVYDNPTPPNAAAVNRAAGAFQPLEPRADTTREGQIRATGNGGQ